MTSRRNAPEGDTIRSGLASPDDTIFRVETPDRLGLLYDLIHTLTGHELEIMQALIQTDQDLTNHKLHFTDKEGRKLTNNTQLRRLRKDIEKALAG